jgi:alkanesulfonate monooxygenase SsuD/methylene tetrahydromethanopterin reductase-like flavin-dependent oxidoreductase (luciferase family)
VRDCVTPGECQLGNNIKGGLPVSLAEVTNHARKRPLKIGLFLDLFGYTTDEAPRWSEVLEFAQVAEQVGIDSLWIPDHLNRNPSDGPGVWECWSILSALAATTRRIELGTFVLCTNFRNPALVAKMADSVDEISGGRLILGLGAGWHEGEFRSFGFPYDHRVSRFEEALTIIRTLLREGHIDFTGRYYQARDCELAPRGPRPAGPPILIGTKGERMLRLAARYADMWNATIWFKSRPEEVIPLRTALDAACADVGRDPATITRSVAVVIGESIKKRPDAELIQGEPAEVAQAIRAIAEQGIAHLQVALSPSRPAVVEKFARVLEILDRG